MINTAQIRAAASAAAGDIVGISKAQLEELLSEVEAGQSAQRQLRRMEVTTSRGTGRVHRDG